MNRLIRRLNWRIRQSITECCKISLKNSVFPKSHSIEAPLMVWRGELKSKVVRGEEFRWMKLLDAEHRKQWEWRTVEGNEGGKVQGRLLVDIQNFPLAGIASVSKFSRCFQAFRSKSPAQFPFPIDIFLLLPSNSSLHQHRSNNQLWGPWPAVHHCSDSFDISLNFFLFFFISPIYLSSLLRREVFPSIKGI